MKKLSFLLALIIFLSVFTSCYSSDISGDQSKETSGTVSETPSDPNMINSIEGIDSALIYDIDRSKTYEKVNVSNGSKYTLLTEPSSTYPDDGVKLTDEVVGQTGANFTSNDWIGFVAKKQVEFIVELGDVVKGIAEISVNVNYNPSQGRLAPKTVDFYASQDGVIYKRVGTSSAANDDSNMKVYTHHLILQKGIDAKYIKVVMNGITSNWVHIDSFRAYLYKETNSIMHNNDYYINEEMPTVTEDLYWDSSDSDYSKKINLASGLPQRIYLLSPLVESQKTDYYNTPASTTQLTDGSKGGSTYSSPNFVHFTCGMAREIVYDLGKLSAVESVTAGFLVEKATGVNLPNAMYVYGSENGKDWQRLGVEIPSNEKNEDFTTLRTEVKFTPYKVRFVKVLLMIPIHVWVDEIEIFGTKNITGAKTIVPEAGNGVLDGDYPTPDMLGGSNNILLAYNFKNENPSVGRTNKEQYLPYVGYYDTEGKLKDIFFDSYLYLPCSTVCPSGGVLHHDIERPSFASDWIAYEEDTFAEGYNINALNEAVGEVKAELGKDDFIAPVYFSIFSTVDVQNNFGDIDGDGISEDFSKIENRKKALKWWIDRQIKRFDDGNYTNLKLNGFYWYHEVLDFGDPNEVELAQYTSDYLHSLGYYIIWIPYYQASGYSEWTKVGFDIANMQPNYIFNEGFTEQIVYDNAKITKQLGMGVEIELAGSVFSSDEYYDRYMSYLRVGVETGYMNGIKMYYQDAGPGIYHMAYTSTNPKHRAIYDLTYQFAKGKLELGGLEIKKIEFKTEVNTALTSSLGLDDSTIPATAKLAVSAKYGNVALSTSGSFVYTPMTDFKGTESFWVTISNGVSSTTKEIKITVE